MSAFPHAILSTRKLTRAGRWLIERLAELNRPVITPFRLWLLVQELHKIPNKRTLYLRASAPDRDYYNRIRTELKYFRTIESDPDFGDRAFRVLKVPDLPADEIVCLADPLCYVSHLSAMQRWGLTNRTPVGLHVTRPDRSSAQEILAATMRRESGNDQPPVPLRYIRYPESVRHRPVELYETKDHGAWLQVRNSHVRLSTIGQTFLESLQKPDLCGGMSHVLEAWDTNAPSYLEEIVATIDSSNSPIVKCRAGYILEERLGVSDARLDNWKCFAQRGSSRKLDPTKPFSSEHSETWMLSLNA